MNRVGPGFEEGRPRCVCTLILIGAAVATTTTAITATTPVTAVVTAVVVLLLAGLLQQAVLLLLLSEGAHRPTGRSWCRWWFGCDVECSGGSSGRMQPLRTLLDFFLTQVIMYLLKRRKQHRVHEDCVKMIKVLAQPAEDVQDENPVRNIDAEINEGVDEALHLEAVVVHIEIALNKILEGGLDMEGTSHPIVDEAILQGQPGNMDGEATLTGDILKFRRDSDKNPRLDQHIHPIPSRNIYKGVIRQ
jgi:hypothetical protein